MGFELPKDLLKKKTEGPEESSIPVEKPAKNMSAESGEKKPEQEINYQKEFGLNDEQYEIFINLAKTEIKNWPPRLLEHFDNLGVENMPKDGPEMAAIVAGQIKELKLEKEQSPEEAQVTAEIAKEQKEISPGILSKLIPKRLKKAVGVGLVSLSCFAAAGSFSDAEAGGPGRPSFGTQVGWGFKIGALKGIANAFDSTIEDMKAKDRIARQLEQQAAQMEMNMYYQERMMEMNLRNQARQARFHEEAQQRRNDEAARQAAILKGINNPTNPNPTNSGTPSGAAF